MSHYCPYCGDPIVFAHACHLTPDAVPVPVEASPASFPTATELWNKGLGREFEVRIKIHTFYAFTRLSSPSLVRDIVGQALDCNELQEEIDYTLEVNRAY
jgi:hypothetical protein